MTACPMAWARWLFPVPGGPKKSASSRRPTNAAVARSKTRLRFIFLLKLKSKLSRVLCGSRNWACFRRRSSSRSPRCHRDGAGVKHDSTRSDSFWLLLDFEIDEIAIHVKFTDQGIDLS